MMCSGSCAFSAASMNEHRQRTKERHAESELDNFPARYFTSKHGKMDEARHDGWHVEDPQTLNLYAYGRPDCNRKVGHGEWLLFAGAGQA